MVPLCLASLESPAPATIAGCNDIGPPRLVGDRCFFRRATREDRSPRQVCYSKQQGRLVQLQCKALSDMTPARSLSARVQGLGIDFSGEGKSGISTRFSWAE